MSGNQLHEWPAEWAPDLHERLSVVNGGLELFDRVLRVYRNMVCTSDLAHNIRLRGAFEASWRSLEIVRPGPDWEQVIIRAFATWPVFQADRRTRDARILAHDNDL
jgi:hypothetical protein